MKITPVMVGSGRAAEAIARALTVVASIDEKLEIQAPLWLERGKLPEKKPENPVVCIANPHGLHAKTLTTFEAAGYPNFLCEKPVCVNPEEVALLRDSKASVAVFHGYRQMWGPRFLKSLVVNAELGEVFAIEGKYWQSSTAEKALLDSKTPGWKDDAAIAGKFDVFLDLATHWADLAVFLAGTLPTRVRSWRSFANAESEYRDSHVQLALEFEPGKRALGSISKNVHGATNEMEISVLGTHSSASWNFLSPDEIVIGNGRDRGVITRRHDIGSGQAPFHALGWLEGYVEISHQALKEMFLKEEGSFPRMKESLDLLEKLFQSESL